MDYRAELDSVLHPSRERPDVTERAEPPPAAPPREEDPRAQTVRVRLELAVRELDAEIAGLTQERNGLDDEIAQASAQRARYADLAALEPAVFAHLIAVLKLEGPAGDAPEDGYEDRLAEALRDA